MLHLTYIEAGLYPRTRDQCYLLVMIKVPVPEISLLHCLTALWGKRRLCRIESLMQLAVVRGLEYDTFVYVRTLFAKDR